MITQKTWERNLFCGKYRGIFDNYQVHFHAHDGRIGWEELAILSAKENAITGGKVDYKQMDKNNIRLLPTFFRIRDWKNG